MIASLLEFRLLGPVEALDGGRPVALPSAKPRALLALLLLNRNRVVSTSELVDELWGDSPPETAAKALQGYVSQLRKALGAGRLETRPPGYLLRVEDGELDADRFRELVADGRRLLEGGDPKAASERLREALGLWQGPALADVGREPFGRDAAARLEQERLAALEDRIEADLALGRLADLVPELEALVAREPLRERLRALLMLALYRSGRQADALERYRETRRAFVDELGIEPGEDLQELERAILRHDPELELPRAGAPPAGATPVEGARRRAPWLLAAAVAAAAVAAALVVGLVVSRGGGSATDEALEPFVVKVENFLVQSRTGRIEASSVVARALRCGIGRREALARLTRVQRNRQSLLQQAAALAVPGRDDALRASDLLQQAIAASIAADWGYRDWIAARKRCPDAGAPALARVRVQDAQATRAKQAFVAAFDPLARRVGRREWTASEF
jgi:DNA-binding SARP family transcriptional activator